MIKLPLPQLSNYHLKINLLIKKKTLFINYIDAIQKWDSWNK